MKRRMAQPPMPLPAEPMFQGTPAMQSLAVMESLDKDEDFLELDEVDKLVQRKEVPRAPRKRTARKAPKRKTTRRKRR
jgi:hypothetical protein